MKVNFNVPILGVDGKPIRAAKDIEKPKELSDVLLKTIAVNALLADPKPEEKFDAVAKLQRFMLAQKIEQESGECDVKTEEIVMLKKDIDRVYGILIVGAAYALLPE